MKVIAKTLRAFLLVALSLTATPGLAEDILYGQGILWRIDYGAVAPSYLLGTMHTADERVLEMPNGAREAFEAADTLALELLLAEPHARYRATMAQLAGFFLTDGRTLGTLIGEQRFELLSAVLAERGIPPILSRLMNPWAAYIIIQWPPPQHDADGIEIEPLDSRLEIDARAAGKRLFALEATKEQAELMASNDEAFETWLLTEVIDAGEANGGLATYLAASHAQSLDRYDAEDIAAILEDFEAPLPPAQKAANKKFLKRFLWRRNARMVQRMISLIVRGNSFIAVGAAHLPGEKGIVNMLVKRGYKVTRVQ